MDGALGGGGETILLVDDDPLLIDVGRQMIEKLGFTALTAQHGSEALSVYGKHPGSIDLVILDMMMPDMSGKEIYQKLAALDPEVSVLLSSGYTIDGPVSDILALGCNGFIQKPFNLNQLATKIRNVLDSANDRADRTPLRRVAQ